MPKIGLPPLFGAPWESREEYFGGDPIEYAVDYIQRANAKIGEAYKLLTDAYSRLEPLTVEPGPAAPVERENWRIIKKSAAEIRDRAIGLDAMTHTLARVATDLGRV